MDAAAITLLSAKRLIPILVFRFQKLAGEVHRVLHAKAVYTIAGGEG